MASSDTIPGDADPTWWTCSSALGSPAMNDDRSAGWSTRGVCQPVSQYHEPATAAGSYLTTWSTAFRPARTSGCFLPFTKIVGVPVTLSFDIWLVALTTHWW